MAEIKVTTYKDDRLGFFQRKLRTAENRYNLIYKKFKNAPYISAEAEILSDAGRELQFWEDVVTMFEADGMPQSESEWETIADTPNSEFTSYTHRCLTCNYVYKDFKPHGYKYCPDCGSKMKEE